MPAVSVIHSLHDEALGEKIADALSRQGHDARRLGEDPLSGDLMLEDGAAIVIWSEATAKLARLHVQAREALERGALIPITISGGRIPNGFEDLQPVDLSGWGGDVNDPRWRFVLEEITLAAQRLRIEDGSVWMAPKEEVTEAPKEAEATTDADAEAKTEIEPPIPFSEDAVVDVAAVDTVPAEDEIADETSDALFAEAPVADLPPAPETFEADDNFQGPINIAARYQVNTDNYWPETPYPAKKPVRFTARNVVLGGGFALFALTAAAIVVGPAMFSSPTAPDTLREAPLGPNIAFVQPMPNAEEPVETTPAVDDVAPATPSDFEVTSYLEPEEDPTLVDDALALGDDVDGITDASSIDANQGLETDIGEASLDDDPIETLLTETTAEIDELTALSENNNADIPDGNYFRDCASCPEMVALPAGYFQMGTPEGEPSRLETEGPSRAIALGRPFALATREVTHDQWQACIDEGGCRGYRPYDMGWGRGNRPVTNVSYEDAVAYTQWLSQKTGQQYRLPSEAEWEFAARAGGITAFSFGTGISTDDANYNGNFAYLGEKGAFRGQTTPVASFAPNIFGLYDMHGNVWEWTSDCWAASHAATPSDGSPFASPGCTTRVIKGGAWNTGGWRLRAGHRLDKTGGARENDIGFRVARNAP